ncbi:MAG: ABC transporter permease [Verrucomicrobia bacterium]|nr:ABC transporter permease [Verrucomicrobiota bacterium]
MTNITLILRSLRFHARAHLGTVLGALVGSAVLIGALVVGDSVRGSLSEMAMARLGKVDYALASGDRLFRAQLGREIASQSTDLSSGSPAVAAILQLPATASSADGNARANRVQVLGVDGSFWKLANQALTFADIPPDGVVLNAPLAAQLGTKPGDSVLLRVQKPAALSRDAPLSPEEKTSAALRLTVHAIASDAEFGRFSLQANQVAPFNAFVPLAKLQAAAEATNKVNLMLVSAFPDRVTARSFSEAMVRASDRIHLGGTLGAELPRRMTLADAELELRFLTNLNVLELRSPRIFLDVPIIAAATNAAPGAQPVLTYFVNDLAVGTNSTPYSMVTAMNAPLGRADLRDDEILINDWLAADLGAKAGDKLRLAYYVVSLGRKMEERTNEFTVRAVVPLAGTADDRALMPDFPGLANAESCRDWDTGFPIKMERMRDKDQKYWDDHRGTPKAFVTLSAGQKMWANRFGDLTAVRYPLRDGQSAEQAKAAIGKAILQKLDPASIGLNFQPVREQALAASEGATDFSGLFIGFSFFLIAAALMLMALLFQFGIEQRAPEIGTLLALGFTPRAVRRMLLLEGGVLALLGGVLGAAGGIGYARAMLWGLSNIWSDAVGGAALGYHATPMTLGIGVAASSLVSWVVIWLSLRKQARQPVRELLAGEVGEGRDEPLARPRAGGAEPNGPVGGSIAQTSLRPSGARTSRRLVPTCAVVCFAAAIGLIGWSVAKGELAAPIFFGAGGLLLVAAIAAVSVLLGVVERREAGREMSVGGLGVRNATRRRKRSLAIVAMLACGSFLIVAVGANRLDAGRDATKRSAGTGGFALWGETALPVAHDLNTAAGRDFFGLNEGELKGVSFVPFKVREGDEASCLNLNRAQKPRLLGVNPVLLAERGAFTFNGVMKGVAKERPWLLLNRSEKSGLGRSLAPPADDEVPAIGDEASILWALGKKVGDTLDYTDERGRVFKLRLVASVGGSILQGNLVIAESEFVKRFPTESGYRVFLVDAPAANATNIAATLTRAMRDVGLELTPTATRLDAFNAVQNTYLSTFQVLGGLGLLLGSIGLGVVVLRNVLERRSELALLLAVGFRARAVKWLVVSEHGALLLLGLAAGTLAALVAVLPGLLAAGAERHWLALAVTLGAVLASGAVWTVAATAMALRGRLLAALRNE